MLVKGDRRNFADPPRGDVHWRKTGWHDGVGDGDLVGLARWRVCR